MKSGQILQFPLSHGLAEDDNPKAKALASLKSGLNIRWPRSGCIGKRFGATQLGSAVPGLRRFIPRGDELGATDGEEIYVYADADDDWVATGKLVSEVAIEWSNLHDDITGVASSDIAITGDLLIHAWVSGDPTRTPEATPNWNSETTTGYQAFVQIINWRTGQVVLAPQPLTAPSVPSAHTFRNVRVLVADATYAFVIASYDSVIASFPITLATRTIGASQSLKTDLRSAAAWAGRFDACFLASGSLALVYETSTPTMGFARYTRSATTFTSAATSTGTGDKVRCLRIAEDATAARLYVLYGNGGEATSAKVQIRAVSNSTMASALAATDLITQFRASQVSIKLHETGSLSCAVSGTDFQDTTTLALATVALGLPRIRTFRVGNTGTKTAGTYAHATALQLLSDTFTIGARRYAFVADTRYGEQTFGAGATDPQEVFDSLADPASISSFLVEITEGDSTAAQPDGIPYRMVGKIDHDIAGQFQCGLLPQVAAIDSETLFAALPFQATAAQTSFNWRVGLRLVRATVDADLVPDPWRSVTIGREAYLSGGRLGAWDGRASFDYGMRAPYIHRSDTSGTVGSGELPNGAYVYQFEAGYRSHAGVLHRGPLSVQRTVEVESASDTGYIQLTLASHGIDGKQTEDTGYGPGSPGCTYVDAFRSEANGSVVYKLSYEPRFNIVPNFPTDAVLTLPDPKPDADITAGASGDDDPAVPQIALATRPQPYTADGSLEDCQPPAPYTIHLHGGRVLLVDGSRRAVWYSKDYRENPGVAPGFNFAQSETYDQKLTAIASLDDKRIVFHEHGLFYIAGDGPNVQGLDNRFSTPQPIQTDTGCSNPRSVVSWPSGVIFQSGTDLYNLDRGLAVTWIGKDVRDTLASYPTITSAVLVTDQNEIRFTCNNAAGSAGIVLVFDYVRGVWLTRTYAAGAAIRDAILHGGAYYFATATAVYYEDTTTHLDAGVFVSSTVELEQLSPAGPVGWQRVRIVKPIGQSLSNHALTVYAARDWATSYEQSEAFAAGSAVTTVGPYERAEVALTVQRRQSVGLKFVDSAPANTTTHPLGNGAGFQLEGVALLVQPRPGMPRDLSTRRGG